MSPASGRPARANVIPLETRLCYDSVMTAGAAAWGA